MCLSFISLQFEQLSAILLLAGATQCFTMPRPRAASATPYFAVSPWQDSKKRDKPQQLQQEEGYSVVEQQLVVPLGPKAPPMLQRLLPTPRSTACSTANGRDPLLPCLTWKQHEMP